jgi:hypothetical protein
MMLLATIPDSSIKKDQPETGEEEKVEPVATKDIKGWFAV